MGDWVRQRRQRKGSLPVSKKEAGSQNKDNFVKQCCYKLGKKNLEKEKLTKYLTNISPRYKISDTAICGIFVRVFIGEQYRPRQRKYCRGYFEKQL